MSGPEKSHISGPRTAGPSAGAPGPNGLAIQLKGNNLPTSGAMQAAAPKGKITAVFSDTHTYEDIVDHVADYYSNNVPNNDYGQQLLKLEAIDHQIGVWEGKYGPVTQAVVPRKLLGLKDKDKRRQVLLNLHQQIATETQLVKTQGHQVATADHLQDRTVLTQYVNDALQSNDLRLKNSADWILNARKTKLFAVTATGDSFARLTKAGKNPAAAEAFFPAGMGGAGDINDAPRTYNHLNLTDNTEVTMPDNGKVLGGWNNPGFVTVTRASQKNRDKVWETLRHEVQHDADKHKGREALSGIRATTEESDALGITRQDISDIAAGGNARRDVLLRLQGIHGDNQSIVAAIKRSNDLVFQAGAEVDLSLYKTEYRAYSYEEGDIPGNYAALDNSAQDQVHDGQHFSERQLAIFQHIYDSYDHTKNGWDNNYMLSSGLTFRQAVSAYWDPDPEGANKFNSARVDDFYEALDVLGTKAPLTAGEISRNLDAAPVGAAGKESDVSSAGVVHLISKANALHKEDAQYIRSSALYTNKLNNHLDDPAKQAVIDAVTQKAQ